jgi:hypothetical protein
MTSSTPQNPPENSRETVRQQRSRRQFMLVALFLLVVWGGLRVTRFLRDKEVSQLAQHLNGTWELESLSGKNLSATNADLLYHKVTFQNGTFHGETRIRADSPAGTTALPFADATIRQYSESVDGKILTFLWNGTYTVQKAGQVTVQLNKTLFTIGVLWEAKQNRLVLERDCALTYEGRYIYRPALRANASTNTPRP